MDLNGECKGGDGFIDRSRVRILLCDNDSKSLGDVFTLLSECSYQVTSVKSARQVIDALNAEGPDIDMILAEIDLPMSKGMKMLRYITRDKDLRRIPVIMMSRQDEVHVVVKCLKLGAADYLVKPLRSNELLNLWTHMWRRRRMLGLSEKNILNYDFDLVGSDQSDPNTNSTNLFSDDTDERSLRSTNLQKGVLNHQEIELAVTTAPAGDSDDGKATSAPVVSPIEPPLNHHAESHLEPMKRNTQVSSEPKKSRLKIGESSAFFTYVKSTVLGGQDSPNVSGNGSLYLHPGMVEKLQVVVSKEINNTEQPHRGEETEKNYSPGEKLQSGVSYPNPRTHPTSMELHDRNHQDGILNTSQDSSRADGSGFTTQNPYPYYMHGVMNQVMMQPAAIMPHLPHWSPNHFPTGFPYYNHNPMNRSLQNGQVCLQNGQVSMVNQTWSPASKPDRREEALLKFRRKRNQRCFDKKIRYVNRKRLAERRPRVKGQFVSKLIVDLNGQPDSTDYDDEEEEGIGTHGD